MENFEISPQIWDKVVELTGSVTEESFIPGIHALVNEAAAIAHYAVHTFDVSRLNEPTLSILGGDVSEYWAQSAIKQVELLSKQRDRVFDTNLVELASGKEDAERLFRFMPDPQTQPELSDIYEKSNIREKVYWLRIDAGRIYQLNLYRSAIKPPLGDDEIDRLQQILPLATNLVCLRLRICGADGQQKHNKKHAISYLREQGIHSFETLSRQETEVCDLIVYGLTTEGIAAEMGLSLSSIKTYRNRAYKKLDINSKSELFAMIINSQLP